jgi:creatinine amidohydrolase
MQLEQWLANDDRAVLPIGSTEQHAYLSLATDAILAERVAADAAEPTGVPVFPVMPYGNTATFMAYPGTISIRLETLAAVLRDALASLRAHGFRRVLVVNGHGGNTGASTAVLDWLAQHPDMQVKWHNWWNAPRVMAQVKAIDPIASHASWMESFPWTRAEGATPPREPKPEQPYAQWTHLSPAAIRERLGDGCFGGRYQRDDDEMFTIWRVAVEETRALIESGWA